MAWPQPYVGVCGVGVGCGVDPVFVLIVNVGFIAMSIIDMKKYKLIIEYDASRVARVMEVRMLNARFRVRARVVAAPVVAHRRAR